MIAMQLMNPNHWRPAPIHPTAAVERELARTRHPLAVEPAKIIAVFRPLDPGIVSDTIPAFFIGRNKEGFWVARDVQGQIGGIFLLENSAVSFARRISGSAGCATIFPSETIELDLENSGNPLLSRLGSLMRLATHTRRRIIALAGRVVRRRMKDS
jgi:hypothetical protein